MSPVPGVRRMPGWRWYRHQPGLTREARGVFSYSCPQPRRQRVRLGRARGGMRLCDAEHFSLPWPGGRLLGLAAVWATPVLYARWVRPRLLTWGATREEATGSYPGDELVPGPAHSTMATTLPAPPERVWPWLVQMGYDRAGWYSWDTLDHGGEPSADRIVPRWQNLAEGSG